ncbi:DUF2752 domain-containing protein [Oerskovia flava]|uniref:DUF2752 domain-containing protein n=1 Tax=Oerskovia flava TaxID=2986422 RepID=UPI0022400D6B|nr:DUF2752 domain-containing protein [Oerskovia sp. JB1-3-2]
MLVAGPAAAQTAPRGLRGAAAPLVLGAVTAAATVYVALVDPNRPGHYITCPLLSLTGWYCAGCGALRATHDLAHLDVAGAWSMNPLWVLLAPLLVVGWFAWVVRAWRGRSGRGLPMWSAWVLLGVLVGYSVLRNVPALAPWLAP